MNVGYMPTNEPIANIFNIEPSKDTLENLKDRLGVIFLLVKTKCIWMCTRSIICMHIFQFGLRFLVYVLGRTIYNFELNCIS